MPAKCGGSLRLIVAQPQPPPWNFGSGMSARCMISTPRAFACSRALRTKWPSVPMTSLSPAFAFITAFHR